MITSLKANWNWWYSPTAEEKKNIRFVAWKIKISWDWVFHTIQWEWSFAGQPTTFIRLHMCNLKCEWCDARYTRKTDTKEFYTESKDITIDELQEQIIKEQSRYDVECKNITITWWEPMLQQRLIWSFLEKYKYDVVQIETNWTIPIITDELKKDNVYFNCSPKIMNSQNEKKIALNKKVLQQLQDTWKSIFKFVISNTDDIDEVLSEYDFIDKSNIRFMPEWVYISEHREVFDRVIDKIMTTGCNVAVRWQSIIRDSAKRWV